MANQRYKFKCCNSECTGGYFEQTIDLATGTAVVVHCPFCATACVVRKGGRLPTGVTRGERGFDGLFRTPSADELIPTEPYTLAKDE